MQTAVQQDSERDLEMAERRRRALQDLENGAVTPEYGANRDRVLQLLNEALATELICVLRYKRHHEMARGIHAETVAEEFLEHAKEEQEHADELSRRITELNGQPDYNPDHLSSRSHTQYIECDSLSDMIRENLIAERIAIDSYGKSIREIGDGDPTTRRILEHILEEEEHHADELARMYAQCASSSDRPRYVGAISAVTNGPPEEMNEMP